MPQTLMCTHIGKGQKNKKLMFEPLQKFYVSTIKSDLVGCMELCSGIHRLIIPFMFQENCALCQVQPNQSILLPSSSDQQGKEYYPSTRMEPKSIRCY